MIKDYKVTIDCNRPHIQDFDPVSKKTGFKELLPVDCTPYCAGMVNPCGFNMNDVYAYENAASDSVAESILHRINTLPADDFNKDIPLEDKVSLCVPRGWSSPAEYLRYTEAVATKLYNRAKDAAIAKGADDDTIKFDKSDTSNSD